MGGGENHLLNTFGAPLLSHGQALRVSSSEVAQLPSSLQAQNHNRILSLFKVYVNRFVKFNSGEKMLARRCVCCVQTVH